MPIKMRTINSSHLYGKPRKAFSLEDTKKETTQQQVIAMIHTTLLLGYTLWQFYGIVQRCLCNVELTARPKNKSTTLGFCSKAILSTQVQVETEYLVMEHQVITELGLLILSEVINVIRPRSNFYNLDVGRKGRGVIKSEVSCTRKQPKFSCHSFVLFQCFPISSHLPVRFMDETARFMDESA